MKINQRCTVVEYQKIRENAELLKTKMKKMEKKKKVR